MRAYVATASGQGSVTDLDPATLDPLDTLVDVEYSSLNYKDSLEICGRLPVLKRYPMVPGIDLAGRVVSSSRWAPGTKVLATGWGIGEKTNGGYAEQARISADWALPIPGRMDSRQAMTFGTAGMTASLCVLAATQQLALAQSAGPILVTGATGGVGSVAVKLLSHLGYKVAAVTGRPDHAAYLRELGAQEIVPREELEQPPKPLGTIHWAGAVDCVGGRLLGGLIASLAYRSNVAVTGMAAGAEFTAGIYPFILRGARLIGIESVYCPIEDRSRAWRLLEEIAEDFPEDAVREIGLDGLRQGSEAILENRSRGRTVVRPSA